MEQVIDLRDLLKHEITDLYSAEEQIIEALPLMIEKAGNEKLKAALEEHLRVTETQKSRLDEIKKLLIEAPEEKTDNADEQDEQDNADNQDSEKAESPAEVEKPGFFSRLFGGGAEKCKGMEGLIAEGQKMMSTEMSPEASDAAIIASAQKIEHYEICGYGTARAFARELNLSEVAGLLETTLNEEYFADDMLTELAVGKINVDAEFAKGSENGVSASRRRRQLPVTTTAPKKAAGKTAGATKARAKDAATKTPAKSAPAKRVSSKKPSTPAASKKSAPAKRKIKAGSPAKKVAPKFKTAQKKAAVKAPKTSKYKVPAKSKAPLKSKSPLKGKSSRKR